MNTSSSPSSVSLLELQSQIKGTLQKQFSQYVWVKGEIHEMIEQSAGHCYLVLVEKDKDKIVAKARATIWSFTYRMLKPYFESTTGIRFASGIKVSLKVAVEFHEVYGLNLNIKDIDPKYTIGDVALQKQLTIKQLEEDGIIDMNKELPLPRVIQNIAVISSETAAGWQDWQEQLNNNTHQYAFTYDLFPARMQGEEALSSIVLALETIYEKGEDFYDAVVIIRGGGSKLDLSIFDHYELACNIAQFPVPVITGIGHERDTSVADMVAHTALKTPTAVADFIIEQAFNFEQELGLMLQHITDSARLLLADSNEQLKGIQKDLSFFANHQIRNHQDRLVRLTHSLSSGIRAKQQDYYSDLEVKSNNLIKSTKRVFDRKEQSLNNLLQQITNQSRLRLHQAQKQQEHWSKILKAYRPEHILKRGFCIVEQNQQIKTSVKDIDPNISTTLIMKDGSIVIEK